MAHKYAIPEAAVADYSDHSSDYDDDLSHLGAAAPYFGKKKKKGKRKSKGKTAKAIANREQKPVFTESVAFIRRKNRQYGYGQQQFKLEQDQLLNISREAYKYNVRFEFESKNYRYWFGVIGGELDNIKKFRFEYLRKIDYLCYLSPPYCSSCFQKTHTVQDCYSCSHCCDPYHSRAFCPQLNLPTEQRNIVSLPSEKSIHKLSGLPNYVFCRKMVKQYGICPFNVKNIQEWVQKDFHGVNIMKGFALDVEKAAMKTDDNLVKQTNATKLCLVGTFKSNMQVQVLYTTHINQLKYMMEVVAPWLCVEYNEMFLAPTLDYVVETLFQLLGIMGVKYEHDKRIDKQTRDYWFSNKIPVYLYTHTGLEDLHSLGISENQLPQWFTLFDLARFDYTAKDGIRYTHFDVNNPGDRIPLKDLAYVYKDKKIQEYAIDSAKHDCYQDAKFTYVIGFALTSWMFLDQTNAKKHHQVYGDAHFRHPMTYEKIRTKICEDKWKGRLVFTSSDKEKFDKGSFFRGVPYTEVNRIKSAPCNFTAVKKV